MHGNMLYFTLSEDYQNQKPPIDSGEEPEKARIKLKRLYPKIVM
jgi:hypothetical protein